MIELVLGAISAAASVATLGVVVLRPAIPPSSIAPPAAPPDHRISRGPVAAAPHSPAGGRSTTHVVRGGERFWIQAVDADGHTITSVDCRSSDEREIHARWTRLEQSSDVGLFTLWDSHHRRPRGRFSRGIA